MQATAQDVERRLLTAQVISGLLFSLFLSVHIINQMFAASGPERYNEVQVMLRAWYQSPLVEIGIVLTPLLVHVVAAVWRMLRRRSRGQGLPTNVSSRLHRISGIVLLIFFLGHTIATRGSSFFFGVFPEFAGIAFTLRSTPFFYWPYYMAFGLAGLYHMTYGLSVALPVLGLRRGSWLRRPRVIGTIFVVGGTFLLLGILGFGGVLFDVGCPEESAFAKFLESLGLVTRDLERCRM